MKNKKSFIYIVFTAKYLILVNIIPELETSRYEEFFAQCNSFQNCINPYENMRILSKSYLNFPYSNLMYFVMLPFYFIGSIFQVSFTNLTYLFFEILLVYTLKKTFKLNENQLLLIVILNPVIIFSIGILGQLDFIPLTFFALSLLKLKENKKEMSIGYLLLAASTKVVFVVLLPIILLYFIKTDKDISENFKTLAYTSIIFFVINFQLLFDEAYREAIFYGLERGYSVVQNSDNIFSSSLFLVILFSTITFFTYWKNIHRLDFYGITIFSGFLTLPIYITNLSNIGWFLWSLPAIVVIYLSFEYKVKSLILAFLVLLVLTNEENLLLKDFDALKDVLIYFVYSASIIIFYYSIQALTQNIYFKIKSSPIIFSIAGDSASGKTTLSNTLEKYFGKKTVNIVELDSFHKYERNNEMWNKFTHLNPKMNNLSEFRKVVLNLISGEAQFVKQYNHLTGKFDNLNKKRIKDFLIVEGLHSLHFKDLNKKFNLKVFLDVDSKLKDKIKISRDLERQKTEKDIKKEIKKRKDDFKDFILPQSKYSDVAIKTIKSNEKEVSFQVALSEDYIYELEDLISKHENIKINDIEINHKANFVLNVDKKKTNELFISLSKDVINLKDNEFNIAEVGSVSGGEVLIKAGLILYILNRKLEAQI